MTLAAPRRFRGDRNVRLLYALGALTYFQPGLAIWVVYLTDFRGLTLTQVGLMEAAFWGVKVLIEVPSGAIADRFGRRFSFWLGLVLEASGVLLFAFASNFPLLLLSYVLWSGGFSFRSGNDHAYLYDALASEGRAHEFSARAGIYEALTSAAFMVSGIGGAWLASQTTLQTPLILGVIPYLLAMVLLGRMQEPPAASGVPRRRPRYTETLHTAYLVLRRDRVLRYMLLFQVFLSAAFIADILLMQPFLQAQGVALALFGVLQAPARLAAIGGSLGASMLMRIVGVRRLAGVLLAATLGGLLLLALVDSAVAFLGFIALQFALGVSRPAIGAYINDRTASEVRATILSVIAFGTAIVFALVGPFAGIIGDGSLRLAFAGIGGAVLVTAGTCYVLWLRAERAEVVAAQ